MLRGVYFWNFISTHSRHLSNIECAALSGNVSSLLFLARVPLISVPQYRAPYVTQAGML